MKELIEKMRTGCIGVGCDKCKYGYSDGTGCNITGIAADVMKGMLIEIDRLNEIIEKQAAMNRSLIDAVLGGEDEKVQ